MRIGKAPGVLARRLFQANSPASAVDEVTGPVPGIVHFAGERRTGFPSRFHGHDGAPNLLAAAVSQHLADDARGGALLKNTPIQGLAIGAFFYTKVHTRFRK